MDKQRLTDLHNQLYLKYKKEMIIIFDDVPEDDFGSYIESKVVILPKKIKTKQSEWTLFAFLHEIGHVKTNTPNMKRCEQEFYATQWAIDEARRIEFKIPKSFLYTYQEYIWKWRERGIKSRAKKIPTREQLKLVY